MSTLSQATIDSHFPLCRPAPPPATFELGLTLGGTVSAGAYTAGVLDFLTEALDAWTRTKEAPDCPETVPRHRVVVSTIAGASGGAINGAIMLRVARGAFPRGADPTNPFYSAWTTDLTLRELLSASVTSDAGPEVDSLLHCGPLEAKVQAVLAQEGGPAGTGSTPARRNWLADPLRLIAMVGNVTGIPYRMTMTGQAGLAHELVSHADWVRFGLPVDGGTPIYRDGFSDPRVRNDEFTLTTQDAWKTLGAVALATSAFPLAFKSREVIRPLAFLDYRVAVVPNAVGRPSVVGLTPIEGRLDGCLLPNTQLIRSVNVDGGTINNEPLDMTRRALAGYEGRNPRGGASANRAVLLVDPFSDMEALGPKTPPGLFGLAGAVLGELIQQARFKEQDIALAQSPNVYSRFLIAPVRREGSNTVIGKRAIASGGLGGFLGFLDSSFLRHDFELGRYNAYRFLDQHFVFPENNTIIATWTNAQRLAQAVRQPDGTTCYRMIPLVKGLSKPAQPEHWPSLPALPDWLGPALDARLDLLKDRILGTQLPSNWFWRQGARGLLWTFWSLGGRSYVRDIVVEAIRKAMQGHRLLS